jgi:hypothetical protein
MARFSLRRDKENAEPQAGAAAGEEGAATAVERQRGTAQEPRAEPERGGTPAQAAQPKAGQPPQAGAGPEPPLAERVEGLRSWVAQLDRRIGVRTYAGAAALVLALAAAAVALVLVFQLEDESATDSDIQSLREEIAGVEDAAIEAAQEDVQSLGDRLTDIEGQISEIASDQDAADQEISVIKDDIQDLRDQIADIDTGGSGGANAGPAGTSP